MQGLGKIIELNSTTAELIRRVAESRFPEFVRRTLQQWSHDRDSLAPVPVIWGDLLLAITWHRPNGQIVGPVEVVDSKGFRKLFRSLPEGDVRTRIFRSTGFDEEE